MLTAGLCRRLFTDRANRRTTGTTETFSILPEEASCFRKPMLDGSMGEQFFISDNILSLHKLYPPLKTAGTVFALFTENRYRMRAPCPG